MRIQIRFKDGSTRSLDKLMSYAENFTIDGKRESWAFHGKNRVRWEVPADLVKSVRVIEGRETGSVVAADASVDDPSGVDNDAGRKGEANTGEQDADAS